MVALLVGQDEFYCIGLRATITLQSAAMAIRVRSFEDNKVMVCEILRIAEFSV